MAKPKQPPAGKRPGFSLIHGIKGSLALICLVGGTVPALTASASAPVAAAALNEAVSGLPDFLAGQPTKNGEGLAVSKPPTSGESASSEWLWLKTLPKPGDMMEIRFQSPLFSRAVHSGTDLRQMNATYIGEPGEKFMISSVSGEMLSFHTYERGTLWIPQWYISEAAGSTESIEPMYVTLRKEGELSLTPRSKARWKTGSGTGDDTFVAVARWKEWYGVIVPPAVWYADEAYEAYRPAMLWVRDKDVAQTTAVPLPLLKEEGPGTVPDLDTLQSLILQVLKPGDDAAKVKKWLGDPKLTEVSGNLQKEGGKPITLGSSWRYEREDAHLLVTFTPAGKLAAARWVFPGSDRYTSRPFAGDDYLFTQDYTVTSLPQTREVQPEWRNSGTLAYTYLLGAGKEVLLLNGDDGGFSGDHYDASLYAVDKENGKTRWQINAGYGRLQAYLDPSGEEATVFTSYTPEEKQYDNRIRRVRLSDGEVLWEQRFGEDNQMDMWVARDAVILVTTRNDSRDVQRKTSTKLSVLDARNGRTRWETALGEEARVLNRGAADPYVLIGEGTQLRALDPDSGATAWSIESEGGQAHDYSADPYFAGGPRIDPFTGPDPDRRWILIGDSWKRLDLTTGKVLAEYPVVPGERFEELAGGRYLLVQHPLDSADYWGATSFETKWYDADAGKELWRISGKGSKGELEGDILYLTINGLPAAVEAKTGKMLWIMPNSASEAADLSALAAGSFMVLEQTLLYPFGPDLLILDKKTGKLLGRVADVKTGYAELRDHETRNGTLNRSGDDIYVGTANGGFLRFDAKALEKVGER
ncbi:PQQ-like beta-propeller repeat protein [Paenibacillus sp. alder61]|uniref:outer membrane protein assembly factor BamB family protein n=1 Tax=Paenibacillus sp. alder61 TaxID=2862948 RepID=UPI001CD3C3B1|nr:PQQ-binding-like beta-propeller repeat protein [Paenibacillus sp. alder61]MCA1293754.1 PQQ-like beta-propeller repeat protein [Paenibacillus sp. alder61]